MTEKEKIANKLKKYGLKGTNIPKRTSKHPTSSHVVLAKEGSQVKLIRFGQQGVSGAGSDPKTKKGKDRQKKFKARMAKHIAKGKMSAAYWADKVKW
jgi:predicted ATP-dependent Lon-type protease